MLSSSGATGKEKNIFSWAKSQSQFLTMRKFSIGSMRMCFLGISEEFGEIFDICGHWY